jgi:hypothetical protein
LPPLARRIQVLTAGTLKEIEGKRAVRVMGFTLTSAQILARLSIPARLYEAVRTARAPEARADALDAYCAGVWRTKAFIRKFEAALKAQLGVDSPKLRDFGISTARAKQSRRMALRRACSAAATKRARAQAETASAELYLPWVAPANPKPGSEA